MNKRTFKTHDEVMQELEKQDPVLYKEIQNEVAEEKAKWGGKRQNAGRKTKNGIVLKFTIRLSEKEKEFIDYARKHNVNYDELMQNKLS